MGWVNRKLFSFALYLSPVSIYSTVQHIFCCGYTKAHSTTLFILALVLKHCKSPVKKNQVKSLYLCQQQQIANGRQTVWPGAYYTAACYFLATVCVARQALKCIIQCSRMSNYSFYMCRLCPFFQTSLKEKQYRISK